VVGMTVQRNGRFLLYTSATTAIICGIIVELGTSEP